MRYVFPLLFLPVMLQAQSPDTAMALLGMKQERYSLHFQTTYIYQYKPSFYAPYSGTNSLSPEEDKENSLTATLFAGLRLWKGGAIYINPELAGGSGLSGALGMGGSSNGETFRVGDPAPTLYLARGYFQQTFALDNKWIDVRGDQNQLQMTEPENFLRLYIGKYSLGDVFDKNAIANGPRDQFMNWALMNNGAWDYAANTRGYTYAVTAELQWKKMSYRVALAALPTTANGPDLNTDLNKGYSLNAELEHRIGRANRKGAIRVLGYYNTTNLGKYRTSIAMSTMSKPDITASRKFKRSKYGFGINFDKQISNTTVLFGRLGWNDGKTETWAFTEIDRTISLGLEIDGKLWNRRADKIGIALVGNGLSEDHKNYLALGGNGFILGDGALRYAPEVIGECYYSFRPIRKGLWITADYQLAVNPGYNDDRGPANILSVRLHVEL